MLTHKRDSNVNGRGGIVTSRGCHGDGFASPCLRCVETRSQAPAWERLSAKLRFAREPTDSLSPAILLSFRWEN